MPWFQVSFVAPTGWWGYAEADPTLVGVVAIAVFGFALAHVGKRVWTSRPWSRAGGSRHRRGADGPRRGDPRTRG
ncbi:hypothetical protein [Haliangium sp.]|uniref:hypothetical protein n=1 Tax=Haliangium sp. TaxID=2663208 RepID=UPI003D11472B